MKEQDTTSVALYKLGYEKTKAGSSGWSKAATVSPGRSLTACDSPSGRVRSGKCSAPNHRVGALRDHDTAGSFVHGLGPGATRTVPVADGDRRKDSVSC